MPRSWSTAPVKLPILGVPTWLVLRHVDRDLLIVLRDLEVVPPDLHLTLAHAEEAADANLTMTPSTVPSGRTNTDSISPMVSSAAFLTSLPMNLRKSVPEGGFAPRSAGDADGPCECRVQPTGCFTARFAYAARRRWH